jgi:uncharacterized protein (TIGR03089 family)
VPPEPPFRVFADALAAQTARTPGDPAVTYYDDLTGERVELSYTTYANWVAKTASLLQDELGVERGTLLTIDLPTHWLGPVWLGAAWVLGATAGDPTTATRGDLVVCGPAGLSTHAGGRGEVVACSLLPMGARFRTPLPAGVLDFGEVVWSQPDTLMVLDPATPGDVAWVDTEGRLDPAALLRPVTAPARRVTTTVPTSRTGLAAFVAPLLAGRGTVWVSGAPSTQRLAEIARAERADVGA